MLMESYCPNFPALYHLAAALENIPLRNDPALIDDVTTSLSRVFDALD